MTLRLLIIMRVFCQLSKDQESLWNNEGRFNTRTVFNGDNGIINQSVRLLVKVWLTYPYSEVYQVLSVFEGFLCVLYRLRKGTIGSVGLSIFNLFLWRK